MCLVGIGVVTHSDWKYALTSQLIRILYLIDRFRLDEHDDCQAAEHLSDGSKSEATSLLSTTASNGILHSCKNTEASVRQRVRFKAPEGECQQSHSHSHSHSHHHHHHHHHHHDHM